MQQIEVTEANTQFPSLLQQVESGSEIVFTREGRPVARMVPEVENPSLGAGNAAQTAFELTPEQQVRAHNAILRIQARADRLSLDSFNFEEFKRDRDEGRR